MERQYPTPHPPPPKKQMLKICLFCGEPGGSGEHALPKWLARKLELAEQSLLPIHHTKGEGLTHQGNWRPVCHMVTKSICKDCNEGWMAGLEKEISPILGPLIEPNAPAPTPSALKKIGNDPAFQRWLIKTALALEPISPKGEHQKFSPHLAEQIYYNRLPQTLDGYFGWFPTPSLAYFATTGQPMLAGRTVSPSIQGSTDFCIVFQFNHLAIRLINAPGTHWIPQTFIRAAEPEVASPIYIHRTDHPSTLPLYRNIEDFFLAGCRWDPGSTHQALFPSALNTYRSKVSDAYSLKQFGHPSNTLPLPPKP